MKKQLYVTIFCLCLGSLFLPKLTFAAINVGLEVPFGDTAAVAGLADYLLKLYTFIIASIGILATVMIMFHGVQWAAAAGNSEIISKSKDGIVHAIIGVVLAFSSYAILYTINPALVQSSEPVLPAPLVHSPPPSCPPGDTVCDAGIKKLTRASGEVIPIKRCDDSVMVNVTVFGMKTIIHKDLVKSLKQVEQDWLNHKPVGGQAWYPITPALNNGRGSELEGYNCRTVKDTNGKDTGKYSNHSWGIAIDLNPKTNPYSPNLTTDMPADLVNIWKDNGWGWGGDWGNSKDPQHFSKDPKEGGDGVADPQ